MKLRSRNHLKPFKRLAALTIAGAALITAGCGGGNASTTPAITGTLTVLHSFAGADGTTPYRTLIQARGGDLYGTTWGGGASGMGTVFKISTSGTYSVLHDFAGGASDGAFPWSGLIQASDGNFYGTTSEGGTNNLGTVYQITPAAAVTILHAFGSGGDGWNPRGGLIEASDGRLYGMSYAGGTNVGTVYQITTTGSFILLHIFTGSASDGSAPYGHLIQATDGNLYGMTRGGGTAGYGTVFRITTGGLFTVLHSFAGGTSDGQGPYGSLIQAGDGNLYGMTFAGGSTNLGTVFRLTTGGSFTLLHAFLGGAADGQGPWGSLIQAGNGVLYGMTTNGGANGAGTVFSINTIGSYFVLHSFTTTEGTAPHGSLVQASDGRLYGMTFNGGANNLGTIFSVE